ncbi:hypothetical protein GCM10028857_02320 [Salinarchaeum chitinilyticum]
MRRRTYLLGCAGAAVAVAGCSGIGDGSGDSSGDENESGGDTTADSGSSGETTDDGTQSLGPAEIARTFFEAIASGDQATANDLLHSESSVDAVGESLVETYQSANATVEGATVASSGDSEATVEVDVAIDSSSGGRETTTLEVILRTEDGEWRVFRDPNSTGDAVPSVSLDADPQTNGDGQVSALEFTVQSADTALDPGTLSVRVQGQTATGPTGADELVAGDTIVATFDADGSSISAGTTVEFVWSAPSGDASTALLMIDLQDETTGSLSSTLQIES